VLRGDKDVLLTVCFDSSSLKLVGKNLNVKH
jgi:hypothetical protein